MKRFIICVLCLCVLLLSSCQKSQESGMFSREENMMIAHCQFMPMGDCDKYADLSVQQIDLAMQDACQLMPGMPGCENIQSSDGSWETGGNISQLPSVQDIDVVDLEDGDVYEVSIDEVKKEIGGKEQRMYAYNGSIPGPLLRVRQGSHVTIRATNNLDDEMTTIHWHGLRGDNAFDGVPTGMMGGQQTPMGKGDTFDYELTFPDVGAYWYHPHISEERQQELGLYGNILVIPAEADFTSFEDDIFVVLDDIRLETDGTISAFAGGDDVNHALMGRYGNHYFINGDEQMQTISVDSDMTRLYLTNVSNARPYRLSVPHAYLKVVGSDLGNYEAPREVEELIIAPAERYIVDVVFPQDGQYTLINTSDERHEIMRFSVVASASSGARVDLVSDLPDDAFIESFRDKPVDHELELTMRMGGMQMNHSMMGDNHGSIEWEDQMYPMNQHSTNDMIEWIMRDWDTDKENMEIDWLFEKGTWTKVRLYNADNSAHPMQHPIHFHGQRFIVLSENGKDPASKGWKDTVLVPTGQYVDILMDMSNPGVWMGHCHIAEHMGSGMMMNFEVTQ